jgi:hypothetical protein
MHGRGTEDEGVVAEAFVSIFFVCYVPLMLRTPGGTYVA